MHDFALHEDRARRATSPTGWDIPGMRHFEIQHCRCNGHRLGRLCRTRQRQGCTNCDKEKEFHGRYSNVEGQHFGKVLESRGVWQMDLSVTSTFAIGTPEHICTTVPSM